MLSNSSFLDFCKSLKLTNPINGFTSFDLYEHQKTLFEAFETNKRVVARKFRQGGFTTLFALYALWKLTTEKSISCFYTSFSDRACTDFISLMRKIIDSSDLPFNFNSNSHEIKCTTTDSIITAYSHYEPQHISGKTLKYIFIDDAFISNDLKLKDSELLSSLYPMASKLFVVETPNPSSNYFERLFKNNMLVGTAIHFDGEDFFSQDKLEELKKQLGTDRYSREIRAKFTEVSKPKSNYVKLKRILTDLSKTTSREKILNQVIESLYLKEQ